MKKTLDIIGIGAINFDFIFSSKKSDVNGKKKSDFDDGEEVFVENNIFEDNLSKVEKHSELIQSQVGGSAMLAIRTLKNMCPQLQTAYVGVYGNVPEYSKGKNLPQTENNLREFFSSFIDDNTWLFNNKQKIIGCALVKLYKRQRQFINIFTGANNSLLKCIQEKGEVEFINFLASAKWIHITSLKDIYQFIRIIEYAHQAKIKNPYLKISFDPGYDYTKNHWTTLKSILPLVDFLFLSKSEASNISKNQGLSIKAKALDLGEDLKECGANPQIIIIKKTTSSVLINLIDNKPFVRTYYHKKLSYTKILNDTGAGDAFAGGFIAAMLSPYMLSYQPAPIQLASIAACERLKSIDWPETSLKENTKKFFRHNMKNESLNKTQWLKIKAEILKNPFVNFIIGIVTGVIASIIYTWLQ